MKFEVNLNQQTPKANELMLMESTVKEIEEFIAFTSTQKNCAGLAANQCLLDGVLNNKRYFVLVDHNKNIFPYINPVIVSRSKGSKLFIEGCLSWPNKKIKALRSDSISVKYLNLKGELQEENISGFYAQVFQHEYNHLEGIEEEILESGNLVSDKIGRNDPCPCGSGKKYKKCCEI